MKSTRTNVDAHNSPNAPNPIRHLPPPPPPPPMSPQVEVTVSLSVFTVSKITRRGLAGTAKKCTKKRAKHAKNCSTF